MADDPDADAGLAVRAKGRVEVFRRLFDARDITKPYKIAIATAPDDEPRTAVDAERFAADLEADAMASEKLRDGIRAFAADLDALRASVTERLKG